MIHGLQTYSKNGQVNQQASADRPVSSLFYFILFYLFNFFYNFSYKTRISKAQTQNKRIKNRCLYFVIMVGGSLIVEKG